jgi:YD repeat-containing protein
VKISILFLAGLLFNGYAGPDMTDGAADAGKVRGHIIQVQSSGVPGSRANTADVPVQKAAFTKFANGSMDEYTLYSYDQNDVLLLSQSRHSASGALVESIEYSYQNGRLVQKLIKDEQGRARSQIRYQYNDQGLLSAELLTDRSGRTLSSYEYRYDADGNQTLRIINNAAGRRLAETSYSYRNGLLVSSETQDASGRKTRSSEFTYDAQGRRISEQVFDAAGVVVRIVNYRWQGGLETKMERTTATGLVQQQQTNEYGSRGELIRKTIEDIQSQSKRIIEFEYTFRQEQRL